MASSRTASNWAKLTTKEKQLLTLIENNRRFRLVMPSSRQLMALAGYKSPGSISKLMKRLRAKGYLVD
jgi:SOS-response transcriptional repressor LexA